MLRKTCLQGHWCTQKLNPIYFTYLVQVSVLHCGGTASKVLKKYALTLCSLIAHSRWTNASMSNKSVNIGYYLLYFLRSRRLYLSLGGHLLCFNVIYVHAFWLPLIILRNKRVGAYFFFKMSFWLVCIFKWLFGKVASWWLVSCWLIDWINRLYVCLLVGMFVDSRTIAMVDFSSCDRCLSFQALWI